MIFLGFELEFSTENIEHEDDEKYIDGDYDCSKAYFGNYLNFYLTYIYLNFYLTGVLQVKHCWLSSLSTKIYTYVFLYIIVYQLDGMNKFSYILENDDSSDEDNPDGSSWFKRMSLKMQVS